ncbi:MAG TPA: HAD family hydrolase [Dehalococcoidia bacterium]|nr:HAD family hydrolase [Dehalococcoidia bacterium]
MSPLPRAILIDLDDTLLDDSGSVDRCWTEACSELASPAIDHAALRAAIRDHVTWWWSEVDRHRRGRLDLRAATSEIVIEIFRRRGYGDDATARAIANRYRDLREERATLFPGAVAALEHLRSQGVRLGMMTNGAGVAQRAKIERFGLAPYFDHIVIEGELGTGKPDRRVYDTLLSALSCEPADTWAIGDNLEFDVLAPMQLGIHGIWIDAEGKGCDGHTPDRIVAAFCDIVESRA